MSAQIRVPAGLGTDDGTGAACELCGEVELAGAAATGRYIDEYSGASFSRLIHRTPVVDVLVGLGCLTAGYLLLISRRHVGSVGELPPHEVGHAYDTAARMAEQVRREFGGRVVTVEHGSSGVDAGQVTRRACITHAHIHLFPIPDSTDPAVFIPPGSLPIGRLAELRSAARSLQNYYYCSWSESSRYLATSTPVSSQHARRVWASALGRPAEWDWAVFPQLEACRETVTRLRSRSEALPRTPSSTADDGQRETIAAYSAAASWYAARTRTFPKGAALRTEIEMFAKTTRGWVLDAGAGGCRDAALFGDLGRNVIALDASEPLLAAGLTHQRVRKLVADVRAVPVADGCVGAVWCSAVLLHLDEVGIQAAFQEFFRVLAGGGLAQVSVKRGSGQEAHPIDGSSRLRRRFFLYEPQTMVTLAKSASFQVIRTWTEEEADVSNTLQAWVKLLLRKPG